MSNEYGKLPLDGRRQPIALAGDGIQHSSRIRPEAHLFRASRSRSRPALRLSANPVGFKFQPLGSLAVSLYFSGNHPDDDVAQRREADGLPRGRRCHRRNRPQRPPEAALARVLERNPRRRSAGRARDCDIWQFDHRWRGLHPRRRSSLAGPACRAAGQGGRPDVAVVNEGISGARVLRDRMGDNALARFDRDVLSQPHADTVVLMMGINDIGWPDTILVPKGEAAPSAEDVIAGYEQLIVSRARTSTCASSARSHALRGHVPRDAPLRLFTTRRKRPSERRSTTGSAPAASSTALSTSTR